MSNQLSLHNRMKVLALEKQQIKALQQKMAKRNDCPLARALQLDSLGDSAGLSQEHRPGERQKIKILDENQFYLVPSYKSQVLSPSLNPRSGKIQCSQTVNRASASLSLLSNRSQSSFASPKQFIPFSQHSNIADQQQQKFSQVIHKLNQYDTLQFNT